MQRDHHAAVQVEKIRQHPVCQLRRENLYEGQRAEGFADLKHFPGLKREAVRGDEILAGQAGLADRVPGEAELLGAGGMEHPVQDCQPFITVQGVRTNAQDLEIRQHIRFNALQTELGRALVAEV